MATLKELRAQAKARKVKGYSRMSKPALMSALGVAAETKKSAGPGGNKRAQAAAKKAGVAKTFAADKLAAKLGGGDEGKQAQIKKRVLNAVNREIKAAEKQAGRPLSVQEKRKAAIRGLSTEVGAIKAGGKGDAATRSLDRMKNKPKPGERNRDVEISSRITDISYGFGKYEGSAASATAKRVAANIQNSRSARLSSAYDDGSAKRDAIQATGRRIRKGKSVGTGEIAQAAEIHEKVRGHLRSQGEEFEALASAKSKHKNERKKRIQEKLKQIEAGLPATEDTTYVVQPAQGRGKKKRRGEAIPVSSAYIAMKQGAEKQPWAEPQKPKRQRKEKPLKQLFDEADKIGAKYAEPAPKAPGDPRRGEQKRLGKTQKNESKAKAGSKSEHAHDPIADRKKLETMGGKNFEVDMDVKTLSRLDPNNKAEQLYRKAILDPSFGRDGNTANDGNLSSLDRVHELYRINKRASLTEDHADEAGDFFRQGVRGTQGGSVNQATLAFGKQIYDRLDERQRDIFASKVNPDHQYFKGESVDKDMFADIRKRRTRLEAAGERVV